MKKKKKSTQETKDYIIDSIGALVERLEEKYPVHITYNIDHILFLKKK